MSNRLVALAMALSAAWMLSPPARAQQAKPPIGETVDPRQPGAVYDRDLEGKKPTPAPRRDISGTWNCAGGVGGCGGPITPPDGVPYTPLGLQTFKSHKNTAGSDTAVVVAENNDPMCWSGGRDPQGFPRILLHNFRTIVILQTPENVVLLNEFGQIGRTIWTDGRKLPEHPKPTWWGYSVGKWVDDYTFVVETNGLSGEPWLDLPGHPQSDALRVTEEYKRTDGEHVMTTVTLTDPKMYTKPWAILKRSLVLQAPSFTIPENECSPSLTTEYNNFVANPGGLDANNKK
jgi:hypothetical protein